MITRKIQAGGIPTLVAICFFLNSCSAQENTDSSATSTIEVPRFEDTFVIPKMPDPLDYAATDEPAEPFRFEYHFQSDSLTFTIKANQLNERVFCDITFADGSSYPIELYVNEYRVLVADLILATEKATAKENKPVTETDNILVQSMSKTHRLALPRIKLSDKFIKWVSKNLKDEARRKSFDQTVRNGDSF